MTVKSIQTLVSEAMQEIKTINADEALKMAEDNNCNLIDIREARELEKTGSVENSVHISRGMMEIFLDPNSAFFQQGKLDDCLLYTSPSPRDRQKSRMPSSA